MFFLDKPICIPEAIANLYGTVIPIQDSIKTLRTLWPKLAKSLGQATQSEHYAFRKEEVLTYAQYYGMANVLKVPVILEELEKLGLNFNALQLNKSISWADIGCGPATVALGLCDWMKQKDFAISVDSMDQSSLFLSVAEDLVSKYQKNTSTLSLTAKFSQLQLSVNKQLSKRFRKEPPAVLSFVNSLAEIWPKFTDRYQHLSTLVKIWSRALVEQDRAGLLLIVEPGAKKSSRDLLALRQELINAKIGKILTPCLDQRNCGALGREQDWCHEEVACDFPDWYTKLGKAADLHKQSLLFSYLVVAVGASEKLSPDWPSGASRVVSQRMQRKGRTECWLCQVGGKIQIRISKARQIEREKPFDLPLRGQIYKECCLDEKGEVLKFEAYKAKK